MARILIIDDEEPIRFSLRGILEDEGYEVLEAATAEEGLEVADAESPDLAFLDIWLPGMDGLTAQTRLKANHPDLPVVMISGHGTIETAVSAIQQGAYDFIEKPLSLEKVVIVAARALEAGSLRRENQVLRTALPEHDELLGQSPVMLKFRELLARVAPTDVWVLLTGENGTGKELAARALHAGSKRAGAPMIAVNCAAIPEELIESELFGHEKGAFTGADKRREGRFRQADGGTLFLDEIGELPLLLQAKLLRALQQGEVQRVGSDTPIIVDVRVIAATNRNLREEVGEGRFREDLYYRLNVIGVEVPPLRERREDIPVLATAFLERFALANRKEIKGFTPQAMDALLKYGWPGNVRELENAVERAAILCLGEYVSERELPLAVSAALKNGEPVPDVADAGNTGGEASGMTLDELERAAILRTLQETGDNKSEAARRLGITRATLHNKLRRYDME